MIRYRIDGDCDQPAAVVWTGERCEVLRGCACRGADCARHGSLAECQRAHLGCASASFFECGDEICQRGHELCARAPDDHTWCVDAGRSGARCAVLGNVVASCREGALGDVTAELAYDFSCGADRHCASGLEACEITPRSDGPPAYACRSVHELLGCEAPRCQLEADGARYDLAATATLETSDFSCASAVRCRRHEELCVVPRGARSLAGWCEAAPAEPGPSCLARRFVDCLDDRAGGRWEIR